MIESNWINKKPKILPSVRRGLKKFYKCDKTTDIFNKFNGMCAYCGHEIIKKNMHIDHIIPRARYAGVIQTCNQPNFLKHLNIGDVDKIDNLFPACKKCNMFKQAMDIEQFRSKIREQVEKLNAHITPYKISKQFGLIEEKHTKVQFYFEKVLKEN